jgi:hypothetical protein
MSQNPFQSPNYQSVNVSIVPGSQPGGLVPLSVISLILGAFGLFGSCIGMFGIAAAFMISRNPDFPQQVSSFDLISGATLSVLNFIVAVALLVGSFGVLAKNGGLARTFRNTLLGAAIFAVVRIVIGIVSTAMQFNQENAAVPFGDSPEQRWIFFAAVLGFSLIWGIALAGFYIFSYLYFGRPEVKGYLANL